MALARVLIRREPILLLDEPFTGLDEATRLEMLDLVQKDNCRIHNLHTIMVTHEVEDCERIANLCLQDAKPYTRKAMINLLKTHSFFSR